MESIPPIVIIRAGPPVLEAKPHLEAACEMGMVDAMVGLHGVCLSLG